MSSLLGFPLRSRGAGVVHGAYPAPGDRRSRAARGRPRPAPAFGTTTATWSTADIPSQAGRTVVVTGADSGLGLVTARELACAGNKVVQWMFTPVPA